MAMNVERQKRMDKETQRLLSADYRPAAKKENTAGDYLKARLSLSKHKKKQKQVRARIEGQMDSVNTKSTSKALRGNLSADELRMLRGKR